jgi:hypothetical protein
VQESNLPPSVLETVIPPSMNSRPINPLGTEPGSARCQRGTIPARRCAPSAVDRDGSRTRILRVQTGRSPIELRAHCVQSEIRTHKAEAETFTASGCHPSPLLHIGPRPGVEPGPTVYKTAALPVVLSGQERMTGVEPASLTWKARAQAAIPHPQRCLRESQPQPGQVSRWAGCRPGRKPEPSMRVELMSALYECAALPAEL